MAELDHLDPLAPRLHRQVAALLDQLEDKANQSEITIPQRINALIAVGRILTIFATLRRAKDRERDNANSGSKVSKFADAFAQNAARRRATGTGDAVPEPESLDLGDGGLGDDDEGDDEFAN